MIKMFLKLAVLLVVSVTVINSLALPSRDKIKDPMLFDFKFPDKCKNEGTLKTNIGTLKTNINENLMLIHKFKGSSTTFEEYTKVCKNRPSVDTINEQLHHIAVECVTEKDQSAFETNTILYVKVLSDKICSMDETFYTKMVLEDASKCTTSNDAALSECRTQHPLDIVPYLNGRVCNVDFDLLLNCVRNTLKSTTCSYLENSVVAETNILKKHTICAKVNQ